MRGISPLRRAADLLMQFQADASEFRRQLDRLHELLRRRPMHILKTTGITTTPDGRHHWESRTLCGRMQTLADIPEHHFEANPNSDGVSPDCYKLWQPMYLVGMKDGRMVCLCPGWIGDIWKQAFGNTPHEPLTRFDVGVLGDWLEEHGDHRCETVRRYAQTLSDPQSPPAAREPSEPRVSPHSRR